MFGSNLLIIVWIPLIWSSYVAVLRLYQWRLLGWRGVFKKKITQIGCTLGRIYEVYLQQRDQKYHTGTIFILIVAIVRCT